MLRRSMRGVEWNAGDKSGKTCWQGVQIAGQGSDRKRKPLRLAPQWLFGWLTRLARVSGNDGQAVSPYTDTVILTATSVCNATLTVVSPTVLIGPAGMRTCDLTTL